MSFTYTYSAAVNKEIEDIRNKYLPRKTDKLEELKRLDRTVKTEPQLSGLTVGVIGCLLFGIAICMVLEVLGGGAIFGVIIGAVGAIWMIAAYPIYRAMYKRTRSKLVPRIRQLLSEIDEKRV